MRTVLYVFILGILSLLPQRVVNADTAQTVVHLAILDQREARLILPSAEELQLTWAGEMPLVSISNGGEPFLSAMVVTPEGDLVLAGGGVDRMFLVKKYELSIF